MYHSHTKATFALRAKWSFLHHDDFGFGIQSNPATCITCSQSSLYVSSRNPRFSYYSCLLKKSPNFCQLPRRLITFRVCEERERFCNCRCFENNGFDMKFVEKDGFCYKTRRNLVKSSSFFNDFENNGDEYRKYFKKERSCNEKSNSLVKSNGGKKGVNDFRRHKGDRKFSMHLHKKANQKLYCRRVEDEEESNDSEIYLSSSRDFEDRRAENVRKYANNDYCFSRDSKYEANGKVLDRNRDEVDYSSRKKSTLSRDFESDRRDYSSKKNSTISSGLESRRLDGSKKGYGIERVDKEKVVQEIQKNKDDEASFSSWSRKETSMKDFDRKIREGEDKTYTRKGSQKIARNEQYVFNEKEDLRKLIRSQRDDKYNQTSVEETIDDCLKESHLHSQHDSDMRYTDKGESSTSYMGHQSEIDKQVIRQPDLKKSYLRSNNDGNKATSLTSVKNLVDMTRAERTQIDQNETDNVYVNELHETYNNDSRIHSTNTSTSHIDSRREDGTLLRSHRRLENETMRNDSLTSSVENRISRDVINGMETIGQYPNQTNASVIYSRGTEKPNSENTRLEISGNTCFEIREDKHEEVTTSDIDFRVSGFGRNDVERVSNLLEESTIRTKNQHEASSSTTTHKNNNNKQKLQSTAQVGTSSSVNQYKNDAIESARRLDESSSMYVGDFVNNLRQEASPSVNHEKTSTLRHEGEKQSSLRYRNKGPSDEMWEVRGTTSTESSKTKEAKNGSSNSEVSDVDTTTEVVPGNDITRRVHKSLWTYIADIMKIGLGHKSDTSTQRSRRSSSNASVGSEAYYSGEELDEDKDSTEKEKPFDRSTQISHEYADRRNTTIEQPLLPLRGRKSPLCGDAGKDIVHESGLLKMNDEFDRQIIAGISERHDDELEEKKSTLRLGGSTSIPIIRSAFSSRGGDLTSHGEQSSIVTVGMTPPSVPEIESIHMPSSELPELEEVTNKAESEGEMNRRKLRRSKQVLTTQFEEWEEAYKRDREQRLVDELFMREALLEAKKAADSWEVPVGAVLVHNGKIIARGCNLVEELRDSTAHAEMICIRQASNILKSWRLAETTLYVTLEPCAMCAGAILQARVDTVVWGAPNKLLGADGSWVRLFPNGDGGSGSDLTNSVNQNVGPVHPFHTKITIRRGILATECSDTMQQFFQLRRKTVKKKESPPPPCIPISAAPVKLLGRFHNLLAAMFCL